ncbi:MULTISPECIES: hypothetical protein [Aquimarina]|uniref:Uncharacterized protein n=2 Tax=Aquimarina TaxID=290174 RepID=A0A554VJ58_9FLAO|nr:MULTISPECIES: hypothetical protein [Aquimarina]TPN87121.1 hypothetical protein FHK87_05890 [Aquimarina algicola]TSE07907.1 hypothetical protein FOF46_14370 [Aquimarina algiphila]
MVRKKRNLGGLLDALVDKDGLKTEVTITLTNQTLLKIIIGMLLAGVAIVVVANTVKNLFPNTQLAAIEQEVIKIKQTL